MVELKKKLGSGSRNLLSMDEKGDLCRLFRDQYNPKMAIVA
jgi:hypothetical protein